VTVILVDSGPLVALLDRRDRYHSWARDFFATVRPPVHTCEPVLTECCYVLRRLPGGDQAVLQLLSAQIVKIEFHLRLQLEAVRSLMRRYADVPMSLADACLVRMTELEQDSAIATVDSDFKVYRRNRRQLVPTIMPH
jgi:predicted nucleic acid-binding protein